MGNWQRLVWNQREALFNGHLERMVMRVSDALSDVECGKVLIRTPLLLIGGASGQLKGGRHLKYPERTPMSNMLLSVMEKSGIHIDKLGDSTGKLEI